MTFAPVLLRTAGLGTFTWLAIPLFWVFLALGLAQALELLFHPAGEIPLAFRFTPHRLTLPRTPARALANTLADIFGVSVAAALVQLRADSWPGRLAPGRAGTLDPRARRDEEDGRPEDQPIPNPKRLLHRSTVDRAGVVPISEVTFLAIATMVPQSVCPLTQGATDHGVRHPRVERAAVGAPFPAPCHGGTVR